MHDTHYTLPPSLPIDLVRHALLMVLPCARPHRRQSDEPSPPARARSGLPVLPSCAADAVQQGEAQRMAHQR
eukprot:365052-Chlamydomonas_euryale.AAC.3